MRLLRKRQLDKFLARELGSTRIANRTAFGNLLAMEWAALPVLSTIRGQVATVHRGQSFYDGDGLNSAHVPPEDVEEVLDSFFA